VLQLASKWAKSAGNSSFCFKNATKVQKVKEVEGVECLSFYIEVNKKLKLKNS
jgi:hypothetical protein